MAKGQGQEERAKGPPYSLPLTLFHVCFPPFPISRHCPLSTVHYAWNRLVHSGPESFFQCRCKDLQMSIQEHLTFIKAHTHAATIPALALVKRHFFFFLFSVSLQRKVFGDLFLMMVLHRRSKRVKMFSETFVTMYPYKRDRKRMLKVYLSLTPLA